MADKKSRKKISITAYWGVDDAESAISPTPQQWQSIEDGGEHVEHSESWYEGESEEVTWSFTNGLVTIDGEGGRQCLVDSPISELYVDE
jgi:hypothetical protein